MSAITNFNYKFSSVSSEFTSSLPFIAVPRSGGSQSSATTPSPGCTISPLSPLSSCLVPSITPIIHSPILSPDSPNSTRELVQAQQIQEERMIELAYVNRELWEVNEEYDRLQEELRSFDNPCIGTGLRTGRSSIQGQSQPTSQGGWSTGGVLHRVTRSLLPSAQGIAKAVVRILFLSAAAFVTMGLTSSHENS